MEEWTKEESLIEILSNLVGILETKGQGSIIPEDRTEEDDNLLLASKQYLTKLIRKQL